MVQLARTRVRCRTAHMHGMFWLQQMLHPTCTFTSYTTGPTVSENFFSKSDFTQFHAHNYWQAAAPNVSTLIVVRQQTGL